MANIDKMVMVRNNSICSNITISILCLSGLFSTVTTDAPKLSIRKLLGLQEHDFGFFYMLDILSDA